MRLRASPGTRERGPGTVLHGLSPDIYTRGGQSTKDSPRRPSAETPVKAIWITLVGLSALSSAAVTPVTKDECAAWCNHLIPLPHGIGITRKVIVRPQDMGFRLCVGAGEIEQQARSELKGLLQAKAGVEPTRSGFEIHMGVVDARGRLGGIPVSGEERLRTLPNNSQAYLIQPSGESKLLVAALDPKGVYYGVRTLIQLLAPRLIREQVVVPLASVVDWPDLAERGFWNCPLRLIPHNAALKMDFMTINAGVRRITRGESVQVNLPTLMLDDGTTAKVLDWARLHAMTPYAKLSHLNYWATRGLYEAYPELGGKGDKAYPAGTPRGTYRNHLQPCASNPLMASVVGQAMRSLAEQGVPEIAAWLSETPKAECQCEECRKIGQLQAETNAVVAGWQEVRQSHPDLRLRIFFSLGNDDSERTRHCLETLPPEVIIEKVYGMQKPYVEAAARGRTVINYSGQSLARLFAVGLRRYAGPFRSRIADGFRTKLAGVLSISYFYSREAPKYHSRLHSYNMSALAEWSWNVKGRSSREFAVAWATRQGYSTPEKFADWIEIMEPVESPMVTWHRPQYFFQYDAAKYFSQGKARTYLSDRQIADGLAACECALPIADALGGPQPAAETRYVLLLLQAHGGLNALSAAVTGDLGSEEGRRKLQHALAEYQCAVRAMAPALDPLMGLCSIEPASFAKVIKRQHAEGWQRVEEDITAAVAELLK